MHITSGEELFDAQRIGLTYRNTDDFVERVDLEWRSRNPTPSLKAWL